MCVGSFPVVPCNRKREGSRLKDLWARIVLTAYSHRRMALTISATAASLVEVATITIECCTAAVRIVARFRGQRHRFANVPAATRGIVARMLLEVCSMPVSSSKVAV